MILHEDTAINLDDRVALNGEYPYGVDTGAAGLYEGRVQLIITPFESFSQVKNCKASLENIIGLEIVSSMWSEEEGFSIIVDIKTPLALESLLRDMPDVASVQPDAAKSRHGRHHSSQKIEVVLKTPSESSWPILA